MQQIPALALGVFVCFFSFFLVCLFVFQSNPVCQSVCTVRLLLQAHIQCSGSPCSHLHGNRVTQNITSPTSGGPSIHPPGSPPANPPPPLPPGSLQGKLVGFKGLLRGLQGHVAHEATPAERAKFRAARNAYYPASRC